METSVLSRITLMVLAINLYFIKISLTQSCTPTNYVGFRDRTLETTDSPIQVPHPGRFLATAYIFGCNGVVTNWEAYTFETGAHPIEFHVWRANGTLSNLYHLVGMNVFQNVQPVDNFISFSVPEDEQITVAPGDIAGIRTIAAEAPEGYRIQFDNGGSYIQYIPLDESLSTPTNLNLNLSGGFSTIGRIIARSPIMRATVLNLDFASTTTTETNTTDATIDTTTRTQAAPDSINPFPQSAIIAIAVSGGVVILAAVIVLITCLICCLLYKSRSTKAGTRQDDLSRNQWQNSGALVNNPSYNYNDGISRDRLAANPAYNQGHVQLMDNSAYNANGGDDPYYSVIRE